MEDQASEESRIQYLENELGKLGQSFTELIFHYTTLHNFLVSQFGETFKGYVLEQQGQLDDNSNSNGSQCQDDGGVDEGLEEDPEGTEEDLTSFQLMEHENDDYNNGNGNGDQGEEEVDEDISNIFPPSAVAVGQADVDPMSLLDFNVNNEDDGVEDDSVQVVKSFHSRGVRRPSQVSQNNKGPGQGLKVLRPHASGPTRQPPPLLLRKAMVGPNPQRKPGPPGMRPLSSASSGGGGPASSSSSTNNRGNEVLLSNDDADFKAGKYSKFYMKVNEELIQCRMCHKILKRRGKFIQHLRTHTGEKPFKCEHCPASFSRKDNMNVHVAKHHPSWLSQHHNYNYNGGGGNARNASSSSSSLYQFQCPYCPSYFSKENILSAHVKLKHPEQGHDQLEDASYPYYEEDEDSNNMLMIDEDEEGEESYDNSDGGHQGYYGDLADLYATSYHDQD